MGISINEIVTGRKTFFITPDLSLFPEAYLEDYFALGYECYFVENDKRITIQKKLDILISLFHDVIFFFNIDYEIPDVDWEDLIRDLMSKYNNQVNIGVLYTKRQSKDDKLYLERKYLMDIGITCGCIQLEYQKKQNFDIIEKILAANQAQGRRKNIRALCTKTCTFSFHQGKQLVNGVLQDMSLSHFSIVAPAGKINAKLYEKIEDVHFNIKGFIFRSDVVLLMERPVDGQVLYVFNFVSSTGANGLEMRIKQLLIPNLYKLMSTNCKSLLDQIYERYIKKNNESLEG